MRLFARSAAIREPAALREFAMSVAVRVLTLYHDGTPADWTSMPAPILPGGSTLYIGTWNMNTRYLNAVVDDFAIWSRALAPDEIAVLSRQPVGD